jgi:hypothetical protein
MPRRLLAALLVALVVAGVLARGVAWAQGEPSAPIALPAGGGAFLVNVGDLTFPGAVFLSLWMLARALPGALRSWTPTIRVELVGRDREPAEPRT